ncbi:MAG: response regulator [Deltaproteobacteria bacterium]|nr:response regulator [Deltaproteobacteria bacterium]
MPQILIIDDEQDILDLLSYNLKKEGFSILTAKDGISAKGTARKTNPDLIILDLMLPGIDGLELCRFLKKDSKTASIPIIMLTAKGQEMDKVTGLEMGADDYVTKPFSVKEITARVKALLRRTKKGTTAGKEIHEYGGLHADLSSHDVKVNGKLVMLSPLEFKLLKFFITHQERVYNRDQLLDLVWGDEAFVEPRTVDVHIRRLREKIEPEGARLIKTVRGTGYRFSVE